MIFTANPNPSKTDENGFRNRLGLLYSFSLSLTASASPSFCCAGRTCDSFGASSSNTTHTLLIFVSSVREKSDGDKFMSIFSSFLLPSFAATANSTFVDLLKWPKIGCGLFLLDRETFEAAS